MAKFAPRLGTVQPLRPEVEHPDYNDQDVVDYSDDSQHEQRASRKEREPKYHIRDFNDIEEWAPLRGYDDDGEPVFIHDDLSQRMGRDGRELTDDYLIAKLDEFDSRITEAIVMRRAQRDLVRNRFRDMIAALVGPENRIRWNRSENLIDSDTRRVVNSHLAETNKITGKIALGLGALASFIIFLGALFADYAILSEFWTRSFMNEFLEVPPALVSSLWSKSLQVLFAAVAIHFLISRMTHFGRGVFISGIAVITVLLLISIGTLSGQSTPRTDAATAEQQSAESVDETLAALGLAPAAEETTSDAEIAPVQVREGWFADTIGWFQNYAWDIWYMSIFLVVTSVGALALHSAGQQGGRLFNLEDEETRRQQRFQLRRLESEFHVHDQFLKEIVRAPVREQFIRRYLGNQITQYAEGASGRDGNHPNLNGIYRRVLESWCALKRRSLNDMANAGEHHVRRSERKQRREDNGGNFQIIPGRRDKTGEA